MTFFATSFTATQPIADGNVDIDAMTMARLHLEFNDRGVAVLGPPHTHSRRASSAAERGPGAAPARKLESGCRAMSR